MLCPIREGNIPPPPSMQLWRVSWLCRFGGFGEKACLNATPTPIEIFQHVLVMIGIVLGLGITRLLTGLARFIQHPDRHRAYPVHLGWVVTVLLMLVHFWWWEIWLIDVPHWNFEVYLFLIAYAILLFMLCALLFPDSIAEYAGYEDFFISRRKWFFGIFAATILFDVVDSLIKGPDHYTSFAGEYLFRVPIFLVLCAIAIRTPNRRFHQAFVAAGLVYEIYWIARTFNTLS